MPRMDVWDVPPPPSKAAPLEAIDTGFPHGWEAKYSVGRVLGSGGFGEVRLVTDKATGTEYAMKSIAKRLELASAAPVKQAQHLDNIRREASILCRLRGSLNVVHLEDIWEDETHVHFVMEYCRGGELLHSVGQRHYSERTVASYMRAVLRTLAQCHHHHILHRDIKPGNFMLLSDAADAPLKALDFGLAVFYNPKKLPCKDLGLDGTPWFMAPEALSSAVVPQSDVWSAGVMAFQLLSGQFPFDDWKNTKSPALSLVWKSILTEEPRFSSMYWRDISPEAKDFVKSLLVKDPKKRPSARAALGHPWLKGRARERTEGRPLQATVVQRLQRFGTQNVFKRTILDMIANELLTRHVDASIAAAKAAAAQPAPQAPPTEQLVTTGDDGLTRSNSGTGHGPSGSSAGGPIRSGMPPRKSMSVHDGLSQIMSNPRGRQLLARNMLRAIVQRNDPKCATVHGGVNNSSHDARAALKLLSAGGRSVHDGTAAAFLAAGHSAGHIAGRPADSDHSGTSSHRAANLAESAFAGLPKLGSGPPNGIPELGPSNMKQDSCPEPGPGPEQLRSSSASQLAVSAPRAVPGEVPKYHGPVKDTAAAANWDLQYMLNRTAREGSKHGSVHALQHFAWLLGGGEQTLTSSPVPPASVVLGADGSPATPPAPLLSTSSPAGHPFLRGSRSEAKLHGYTGGTGNMLKRREGSFCVGSPGQSPLLGASSGGGSDELVALYDAIRHRHTEHRKMQRLILDSSGHNEDQYFPAAEAAAAAGGGGGLGRPLAFHLGKVVDADMAEEALAGSSDDDEGDVGMEPLEEEEDALDEDLAEGHGIAKGEVGRPLEVVAETGDAVPFGEAPAKTPQFKKHSLDQLTGKMRRSMDDSRLQVHERRLPTSTADAAQRVSSGTLPSSLNPWPSPTLADAPARGSPMDENGRRRGDFGAYAALQQEGLQQQQQHAATDPSSLSSSFGASPTSEKLSAAAPESPQPAAMGIRTIRPARWLAKESTDDPLALASDPSAPEAPTGIPGGPGLLQQQLLRLTQKGGTLQTAGGMGSSSFTGIGGSAHVLRGPAPSAKSVPAMSLSRQQAAADGRETASGDGASPGGVGVGGGAAGEAAVTAGNSASTGHAGTPGEAPPGGDAVGAEPPADDEGSLLAAGSELEIMDMLNKLISDPNELKEAEGVLKTLNYDTNQELTYEQFLDGLKELGYQMTPQEVTDLLDEIGSAGTVTQSQFLASQIDWKEFQTNHWDEWLSCLRSTFDGLASSEKGIIGTDQLVELMAHKLPKHEINFAVQETLMDSAVDTDGLDFDAFVQLLRSNSEESLHGPGNSVLDVFSPRSRGELLLDRSLHNQQSGGAGSLLGHVSSLPEEAES